MRWRIREEEPQGIAPPPQITEKDRLDGLIDIVLSYGFSDFFDSLQIFCSQDILGLGIGNVDHRYPLFGIPTLRFSHNDDSPLT
ncbi:MAG: hypothetical protein WB792_00120 [Desulfobacterales bacterium]